MNTKYIFGSQLLKLDYPRDGDWVTFVNRSPSALEKKRAVRSIPMHNKLISDFINGKNQPDDIYKTFDFYQLSVGFRNDENYPFKDFNILEHKKVWIDQLKAHINTPEAEQRATKNAYLTKHFYHILYQYHMIKENTHWISDSAKKEVQRLHDLEAPASYFYELRDLINSLQGGN